MVIDYVLYKVFPPGASSSFTQGLIKGILGKIVPGVDAGETIKRGLGALADLGISALKGDPSFKLVAFGNPDGGPLGLEIEIKPPAAGSGDSPVTLRGNIFGSQWATQGPANSWGTPK